jgi:hypothetical protein
MFIVLCCVFQVNSFAGELATPEEWEMIQQTEDKYFDVRLICGQIPSVGSFQHCQLEISKSKSDNNDLASTDKTPESLNSLKIIMDGGMPAHQHGLPTSPVVHQSETSNIYNIEGLKFSMSGEWLLNFYIEDTTRKLKDSVIFKFSID